VSDYSDLIIADGAEAFWPLNEPSGTTMADATGHGHGGTYSGGFVLGEPGLPGDPETSVLLNGTSGFGSAGVIGVDISSGDWTLEAWINPTALGAGHRGVIGSNGSNTYAMTVKTGKLLVTNVNIADAPAFANTDMPVTVWSYVAATFVDSSNLLTYYLNGLPDGSTTFATSPTAGAKTSVVGSRESSTDFFEGHMAKAAIYKTALSDATILSHWVEGWKAQATQTIYKPMRPAMSYR
jgi:hypothetical protein